MKIGILADLHGNHKALEAVLNAAEEKGVEKLLITGDFVGYYFWPKEVLELLADWDVIAIRGNHEEMLKRGRDDPMFLKTVDAKYGTGLRVALQQLSTQQINWLTALPHPLEYVVPEGKILLCHGAPWDVDQYVYPDADEALLDRCAESGVTWVVLGHTHYPMVHQRGETTLINPGSVGQPRNRAPGAQWAFLNTASGKMKLINTLYDVSDIAREAQRRHPETPYLARVLERAQ